MLFCGCALLRNTKLHHQCGTGNAISLRLYRNGLIHRANRYGAGVAFLPPARDQTDLTE